MKNFKELHPAPVAGVRHYGKSDCPDQADVYTCTLDKGHSGPHEAAGVKHIFATWEDE